MSPAAASRSSGRELGRAVVDVGFDELVHEARVAAGGLEQVLGVLRVQASLVGVGRPSCCIPNTV